MLAVRVGGRATTIRCMRCIVSFVAGNAIALQGGVHVCVQRTARFFLIVRLRKELRASDSLRFTYLFAQPQVYVPGSFPQNGGVSTDLRHQAAGVSEVHTFSPRIVNEATGASATVEGVARIRQGLPRAHRLHVIKGELRLRDLVTAEALRQGAEGWTDESLALHGEWDFDPGAIRAPVTWWHGDDDLNAPLSAAERAAARVPGADLRILRGEGHFASLTHAEEIGRELLTRA